MREQRRGGARIDRSIDRSDVTYFTRAQRRRARTHATSDPARPNATLPRDPPPTQPPSRPAPAWANWEAGADDTLILPRFEDGEVMSEVECEEAFPKGHFEVSLFSPNNPVIALRPFTQAPPPAAQALYPYFRITPIPDTPGVNIFPEGDGQDDRDDL